MTQKISNADKVRNYFKEHPTATLPEAQSDLPECNTVKSYVYKDIKAGLCRRREDGTVVEYDDIKKSGKGFNGYNPLYMILADINREEGRA